jgi:hypothetical protein
MQGLYLSISLVCARGRKLSNKSYFRTITRSKEKEEVYQGCIELSYPPTNISTDFACASVMMNA